ncbi:MAG: ABC transporter ATP-binding protein [Gemmatimonadaceae bacterium]
MLSSATLRAEPGELRVLFGRNGAGKSTLLKIAAGLLAPDSGSVHFGGHAYPSVRLAGLASRGLFYLPDYDLLSDAFTVRHQLEMVRAQFSGSDVADAAPGWGSVRISTNGRPRCREANAVAPNWQPCGCGGHFAFWPTSLSVGSRRRTPRS